jgi:dTMP kinase
MSGSSSRLGSLQSMHPSRSVHNSSVYGNWSLRLWRMESDTMVDDIAVSPRRFGGREQYPGTLVVIEGGDRSGRSTQVSLLHRWLEDHDIAHIQTDWSTSPHISKAIHKAKAENALRPMTYSLFYAADFADRVANAIVPALERGEVVVADRYVYTAFARDIARGANRDWLEALYAFAPEPDVVFYLRVPPDVTQRREPSMPAKALDQYEFGLDLGLSSDPEQSFRLYQQRVFDEFERLTSEQQFVVIDGERQIEAIHRTIRDIVKELIQSSAPPTSRGSSSV